MNDVTDWYDAKIEPARIGVYQKQLAGNSILFSCWNGLTWGSVSIHKEVAWERRFKSSLFRSNKWRGLANEPNSLV